ncbi:hypothetical protein CJ469_03982 [Nocardia farcinica]|uniref:pyridoxamine 5'-phosphate oxidase family protein n=1 Tax=Nocardia farcinica TaxID=37329 RepID=UPI000BF99865|nr:pyridoxamine 5'-phosphate oxidase family protein [Nocardia farcinica]PFX01169.1 hypothetical protein CJ469_03982 [Nocardia farcinica]PFX07573.1 hypothetical protein CJ468_03497 [Nocardia farcinica]
MPDTEPTVHLDPRFSSPDATPPTWSAVRDALDAAALFWLSTVRRDGRPHVVPLPAVLHDGALHFCTGEQEQKAVNLAADPRCALSHGNGRDDEGLDVVVEGTAVRVTDRTRLETLAQLWKTKLDWDFEATDRGFREVHGSGEAVVFALTPVKVLAFAKGESYSQTAYRF